MGNDPQHSIGWGRAAILALAVLFAGRALWLALENPAAPENSAVADVRPGSDTAAKLTSVGQADGALASQQSPSQRMASTEWEALYRACPTGATELPDHLKPAEIVAAEATAKLPDYQETAYRASVPPNPHARSLPTGLPTEKRAQLTAVRRLPDAGPYASQGSAISRSRSDYRLAQREVVRQGEGWLVPPEQWSSSLVNPAPANPLPAGPSQTGPTAEAAPAAQAVPPVADLSVNGPILTEPIEATSPTSLDANRTAAPVRGPSFAPAAEPTVDQPAVTPPPAVQQPIAPEANQSLVPDTSANSLAPDWGGGSDSAARSLVAEPSAPIAAEPTAEGTETTQLPPVDTDMPVANPYFGNRPAQQPASDPGTGFGEASSLVTQQPVTQPIAEPQSEPQSQPQSGSLVPNGAWGNPNGGQPRVNMTQPSGQSLTPRPVAPSTVAPQAPENKSLTTVPVTPLPTQPAANSRPETLPAPRSASPSAGQRGAVQPLPTYGSPEAFSPHKNMEMDLAEARKAAGGKSSYEAHHELYLKTQYPSALDCAQCHKRAYDQWSTSSHAYAFVSPMFHKFEQTISFLSQGTVGHFCSRCHAPVATALGYPRSTSYGQMRGAEREGVTCIACHRVPERHGKTNGERRIQPGSLSDPIYGGIGGDGVARAMADPGKYKVKTDPNDKRPGQLIHREGRFFDQLTQAEACTSCHQVAVHPGIKLEVVWEQYRASPACKKGVTCQDCHMGRVPGVAAGNDYGPIAEVGGKTVNNRRKQFNHTFYGPAYSIAHPGIFPQNKEALRWSLDQWLEFDWRAGWGTDDFEDQIEEAESRGVDTSRWFPAAWADVDDRFDARDIIIDNQKKLKRKSHFRRLVMENGSKVNGPFFRRKPKAGRDLVFDYEVTNLNEGHNLPTASLGAQPQLWANVVLIGPQGNRLWETGYTDSKGDLCDHHSADVLSGCAPVDRQLFNLQTMFLITGATGTDREFTLPVNISFDQVPHLRPGAQPISVLNHPPFIRMESRSLSPLGKKKVRYRIPGRLMSQPGRYRLSFRMRSRVEPPYFMRFCDSTPEMIRSMIEGTLDIHPYSVEFEVR